ncbi:hypothetical protein IscW_ISCW009176, partial [Ixodes scapularis]
PRPEQARPPLCLHPFGPQRWRSPNYPAPPSEGFARAPSPPSSRNPRTELPGSLWPPRTHAQHRSAPGSGPLPAGRP